MQKKIYLIFFLFLAIFSGFLYRKLVFNFKDELFSQEKIVPAERENVYLNYFIPYKESLFLKIKTPQKFPVDKIFFNGNYVPAETTKLKGVTYTYHFFIPQQFVLKGNNILKIKFVSPPHLNIDVRLYNYRKKIAENLVIFLKDNHIFKKDKNILGVLFAIIFLLFVYFVILKLLNKIIISKIYTYFFLCFFSPTLFLTLIYFVPLRMNLRIAVSAGFFFFLYIIFTFFILSLVILRYIFSKSQKTDLIFSPLWKTKFEKVYLWISKKSFSEKCIILFMFLLLWCALFLSFGLEKIAEQFANLAYFLLVIGVMGKFIKFLREER